MNPDTNIDLSIFFKGNKKIYWILTQKLRKKNGWCDYNHIMQGPRFPFSEISQRATS